MLEEQPLVSLLRAPLQLHQRPLAEHLPPVHAERDLSRLQGLDRVVRFEQLPLPFVPDDHVSCAVVARRDDALESGVVVGVILRHHRQPPGSGIVGRALRNGPRLEDALHLETEVVVEVRSLVLLNDEDRKLPLARLSAGRFGRLPEVAHRAVLFQEVGHGLMVVAGGLAGSITKPFASSGPLRARPPSVIARCAWPAQGQAFARPALPVRGLHHPGDCGGGPP